MPSRPSRISGACNGCRAKKQKCSGDRAGCAQCLAAGIPCTWPEQRKRGPAKGYIEALEQRLHSAESLLLAILPRVEDLVLQEATAGGVRRLSQADSETSGAELDEKRALPPDLNKKTGIEYWENFPLDSTSHIRRWQHDCEAHSAANAAHERSRAASHSKTSNSLRQLRGDEDRRSSVSAAAATMAGMRHSASSPGTPGSTSTSSLMAVTVAPRPLYENAMSPGRSMSQTSVSSSMPQHLPRSQSHNVPSHHGQPQQQSSMWYQQYPSATPGAQRGMNVNMHMSVEPTFAQNWSNTPAGTAMDVDTNSMHTEVPLNTTRQVPPGNVPGGMYQGDFAQNIFW